MNDSPFDFVEQLLFELLPLGLSRHHRHSHALQRGLQTVCEEPRDGPYGSLRVQPSPKVKYDKMQLSHVIFWSDEPEYNAGNRGGGREPGNGDDSRPGSSKQTHCDGSSKGKKLNLVQGHVDCGA